MEERLLQLGQGRIQLVEGHGLVGMQPVLEMVALCGEDLDNNLLQEGHKVVA